MPGSRRVELRGHAKIVHIGDQPSLMLGDQLGAMVWETMIGPIHQKQHIVQYLLLARAAPGVHRIDTVIVHPDLPDGEASKSQ